MKDDTISRAAAINKFEPWLKVDGYSEGELNMLKAVLYELRVMPPAQPSATDTNVATTDTISRQAAIDALAEWQDAAITNRLNNLPSAQQWIPWNSGRYPDESGWYIVTAYDGNTSRVTFAKYQTRLKRWELTGARAYWRVLAWCELPEPWKGDTP